MVFEKFKEDESELILKKLKRAGFRKREFKDTGKDSLFSIGKKERGTAKLPAQILG
ncbi:2270_t:CDS:2 [Dentiscutata erythropus]|uniref:2270_t:CDS:1 n=1 Tax=Dentiscutata erythropus TaxID=1348616 RepID=A0A9N9J3M8_9GLOM|nr:2270_t:CDS:2 [Dentiscutata erythropus]